jgi:hypothetical protein
VGRHLLAARAGRAGLALAVALAVIVLGCGGDGDTDSVTTPEVTVLNTPSASTAGAPSEDPGLTIENAVEACREKDAERLRAFVAADVSDEELAALFARGDDVLLTVRSFPEIEGGSATFEVVLEVHRGGVAEQVDRTWTLEQGNDGVWRFLELPDCY